MEHLINPGFKDLKFRPYSFIIGYVIKPLITNKKDFELLIERNNLNQIIGYCIYVNETNVLQILIRPDNRGSGIGSRMLEFFLENKEKVIMSPSNNTGAFLEKFKDNNKLQIVKQVNEM